MIELIAIDIDDTLLTSRQTLLPSTIAAVQQALARGLRVVLCSGRPLAGLKPWLTQLGIAGPNQYAVTYNGAVVQALDGKVLASHLLDNATYRRLTAFAQAHAVPFNVLDETGHIYTADRDIDAMIVVQAYENAAGVFVRDPAELPAAKAFAKGLFVGAPARLDALQPQVEQAFADDYVVRAGRRFLEVMHPAVNKGAALDALCARLGIDAEAVLAIGDERNDLPMFAFAGVAVAMGNGAEIAKKAAAHVVATNDEGGVAEAIERFALKEARA